MKVYTGGKWVVAGIATAFMTATSALPMAVQASQPHIGPVSAVSLGQREPTAAEIQNEINLVQSEGLSIRVVAHHVVPMMPVLFHGQQVLASNVPAVEFAVSAGSPSASASAVLAPVFHQRMGVRLQSTRNGHMPADSTSGTGGWSASFGGNPTFYYTVHYNYSCNGACSNSTYMVTHRATIGASGYALRDLDTQGNCGNTGFGNWILGSGSFNGSETTTGISPQVACPPNSSFWYFRSIWAGPNTYTDCFRDNQNCPGDYVRF